MSKDDSRFEEALLELEKFFEMHVMLEVSGPTHTAYYDALRNKIDLLVILANRIPRHVPAAQYPIDIDCLKLLVDVREQVKGLKREDITTQSLDSIIRPRLSNLYAYIGSKYPNDLTLDDILYETEILQTLDGQGFEGLPLVDLNELRLEWLENLAWTSGEELNVSAPFTDDLC